jgi:hypothetical protein
VDGGDGGGDNGGDGDDGGELGCQGTAVLLYDQFNVDDDHNELSLVEFITFYVTYYET